MNKEKPLSLRLNECMKELYLKSSPSLDLDKLNSDHTRTTKLNPNDFKISKELFEKVLKKHEVKISDNCFFFLNKAPKMIN